MLISSRGDKDKARMSQPDRSIHLVRKKYAHESVLKGIGQFILEKDMNKIPIEQRRWSDYFLSLVQACGGKASAQSFKKLQRFSKGEQTRRHMTSEA